MENTNQNDYYANCRVSSPVLYPDQQAVGFNGFAWSDKMGLIHEVSPHNDQDWQQWLGTQQ